MNYQQSIKNLNHLKNFIRAWRECYIFFFFDSSETYKIEIFDIERTDEQQTKVNQERRSGFPYGYVSCEKSGEEILYYRDENITIEYDFFLASLNFFDYHEPIDKKLAQLQFLQLIELLKNK